MEFMTINDLGVILKKILVGIILVVVPLLILWGGLRLTTKVLSPKDPETPVTINSK